MQQQQLQQQQEAQYAQMQQMQPQQMQPQQMQPQQMPAPAASRTASADLTTQLQQLAKLKESGVLSDEEFQAAKAKLLS
jgi:hypothetical protein